VLHKHADMQWQRNEGKGRFQEIAPLGLATYQTGLAMIVILIPTKTARWYGENTVAEFATTYSGEAGRVAPGCGMGQK